MKAVQIGILAALVVCAGLLFVVYRGQQPPAAAPTAPASAAPAPASAAPAPAPVEPAVEQAAPPAAVPAAAPEPVKPSPARRAPKKSREIVAENRAPEPAAQPPAPSPQPAAPAPAETPAPGEPKDTTLRSTEPLPPAPPREPHKVTIAAGTTVTVRLGETISTEKNKPGDTFSGTLDQPLVVDGFAIAERGARVQGKVVDAQQAGRIKGVAHLALALTKIHTSDGQEIPVQTEKFVKEGPTSHGDDAKKVGIGAALGAAIGAIAGGGKGAAIGAGVGGAAGAGTTAATRGKPAELPVETRMTFSLQAPVTVTERLK
ncbi:MAG: hypothetical protein ACM336_02170 [Acidobacteriota bacterium]